MTDPKLPPLPDFDYTINHVGRLAYTETTARKIQREAFDAGRECERSMQGQIPQKREPSDSRSCNPVGETAAAQIAAHHPAPGYLPHDHAECHRKWSADLNKRATIEQEMFDAVKGKVPIDVERVREWALRLGTTQPPAQDAQAVAWVFPVKVWMGEDRYETRMSVSDDPCNAERPGAIPLYAHPPAASQDALVPITPTIVAHDSDIAHLGVLPTVGFEPYQDVHDALRKIKYELAALIPRPNAPAPDDWPCENAADRQCLQIAYETIVHALKAIDAAMKGDAK